MLRPLAKKRGLEPWEKIVNFTKDEWFPSRLAFGKFKGRLYQEAREDAELRSWLGWRGSAASQHAQRFHRSPSRTTHPPSARTEGHAGFSSQVPGKYEKDPMTTGFRHADRGHHRKIPLLSLHPDIRHKASSKAKQYSPNVKKIVIVL